MCITDLMGRNEKYQVDAVIILMFNEIPRFFLI